MSLSLVIPDALKVPVSHCLIALDLLFTSSINQRQSYESRKNINIPVKGFPVGHWPSAVETKIKLMCKSF